MSDIIITLIDRGGYIGIAVLMALENIIPPIPSEIIMGLGGLAVARGTMQFWPLLIAGTIGSTFGNWCWYWLGNRLGYERLGPFIDRWGRWLTMDWQHVEQASHFLRKHGQWVVFFLRFSPFLRTIISLPAGLAHMGRWRFLIFTFLGAGIWNALLILGGQWLHRYQTIVEHYLGPAVIAFVALAAAAYLWRVMTWVPRPRIDPDQSDRG